MGIIIQNSIELREIQGLVLRLMDDEMDMIHTRRV